MESTLEVRWYVKGNPPAAVRYWFEFECPGKLLGVETRKDWYAYFQQHRIDKFARFSDRPLNREEVNLKLRQGKLELKLRQQEFGTYRFTHARKSPVCEGKVEQWCKFKEEELNNSTPTNNLLDEVEWTKVEKERAQKIERGVQSELTYLKIDRECWWSIAFEMTLNDFGIPQDNCFQEVIDRALKSYCGAKLSAINSFGYSKWLLKLTPQTVPHQKIALSP